MNRIAFLSMVLAFLAAEPPNAWAGSTELPSVSLLLNMPSGPPKLRREKKYLVAEYCPDNTCDILKVPQTVGLDKLDALVVAYFYYISTYYELAEWRRDSNLLQAVDPYIRAGGFTACKRAELKGRELAGCELRSRVSAGGIRFYFSRDDEGFKAMDEVSADDALR